MGAAALNHVAGRAVHGAAVEGDQLRAEKNPAGETYRKL